MRIWEYLKLQTCPKIEDGALFVSDAHYSKNRNSLQNLITQIEQKRLQPTQIFWMGDIFDLAVGGVDETIEENSAIIDAINAFTMPQYYFEGNHDFNLKDVFHNLHVIPRKKQPFLMQLQEKRVALSHGDLFLPKSYSIYINLITHKTVLFILKLLNRRSWITKKIARYNNSKNLCKKMQQFDLVAKQRVKEYKKFGADIVIEGHFHQNYRLYDRDMDLLYLNLPAFICNQSFFVVKSEDDRLFIEQKLDS